MCSRSFGHASTSGYAGSPAWFSSWGVRKEILMHFVTASTCRPDSQTQLTVRWVFFFAVEWDGLADGLTRWIIRLSSFGSGLPNLGMYEAWHAGSTAKCLRHDLFRPAKRRQGASRIRGGSAPSHVYFVSFPSCTQCTQDVSDTFFRSWGPMGSKPTRASFIFSGYPWLSDGAS